MPLQFTDRSSKFGSMKSKSGKFGPRASDEGQIVALTPDIERWKALCFTSSVLRAYPETGDTMKTKTEEVNHPGTDTALGSQR